MKTANRQRIESTGCSVSPGLTTKGFRLYNPQGEFVPSGTKSGEWQSCSDCWLFVEARWEKDSVANALLPLIAAAITAQAELWDAYRAIELELDCEFESELYEPVKSAAINDDTGTATCREILSELLQSRVITRERERRIENAS